VSRLVAVAAVSVLLAAIGGPAVIARPQRLDLKPQAGELTAVEPTIRVGVARPGGGYDVTAVPLETYVARVLAGEAARDSPPASLEALAIAIRTYTLANLGRHRGDGFDLCDETHCQVMRTANALTQRAAAGTLGRVLLRDGAPASIYYSASCGGRTEIPSEVWPGAEDPPYLPSQRDDGCGGAPVWSAELTAGDLTRAFRAAGYTGVRLRSIRIASRNRSGRVSRLRLDGLSPNLVSGQDLRVIVGKTLGWQFIKSTAFELEQQGSRFRFDGHGSGHGVGMCVIGSMRLAAMGVTADDILHRYYPGLAISPVSQQKPVVADDFLVRRNNPAPLRPLSATAPAPPSLLLSEGLVPSLSFLPGAALEPVAPTTAVPSDLLVSLPPGAEGERRAITEMALRARNDLSRLLAVPAPRVALRFHPTAQSYEAATGVPWFTSAEVVNGEIHLLPPAVLRDRGVLDRTLRRQLVRVMTNAALADRPMWVREGAASYYADRLDEASGREPARAADAPRTSCPADSELKRPVSPGALSNAYARAASCFARDLAKRKSWRDIK
jgi:SpoIID/LytB domain protein